MQRNLLLVPGASFLMGGDTDKCDSIRGPCVFSISRAVVARFFRGVYFSSPFAEA
jgi:hypothetical protein